MSDWCTDCCGKPPKRGCVTCGLRPPRAAVNRPNAPQDYRTPPALLDAVQERFGTIDFDAACTAENATAQFGYCYPDVDALAQDWTELVGLTVFCNPPWRRAGAFARKCAELADAGGRVLFNAQFAPDTRWYAEHVHGRARVLALVPRVPYLNPDGTPAFVDSTGKALGVNRPVMLAVYGREIIPGMAPWVWKQPKNKQKKEV